MRYIINLNKYLEIDSKLSKVFLAIQTALLYGTQLLKEK